MNCISSIAYLCDAVLAYKCIELLKISINVSCLTLMWYPMETMVAAFIMAHIAITISRHCSVRLFFAQQCGTFRLNEKNKWIWFEKFNKQEITIVLCVWCNNRYTMIRNRDDKQIKKNIAKRTDTTLLEDSFLLRFSFNFEISKILNLYWE